MEGSAVALGALTALTRLKVQFPVECWLAICTNHIGPDAYNPGDIVTAVDGTTIEIVHTDAEGRMVLADTLALASRSQAETDHRLRHPDRRLRLRHRQDLQRRIHQPGKSFCPGWSRQAWTAANGSGRSPWMRTMTSRWKASLPTPSNAAATPAWTISSGRASCNGSSSTTARGYTWTSPPATTRAAWPTSPPTPQASGCALP